MVLTFFHFAFELTLMEAGKFVTHRLDSKSAAKDNGIH
jgi:hypothetical protein